MWLAHTHTHTHTHRKQGRVRGHERVRQTSTTRKRSGRKDLVDSGRQKWEREVDLSFCVLVKKSVFVSFLSVLFSLVLSHPFFYISHFDSLPSVCFSIFIFLPLHLCVVSLSWTGVHCWIMNCRPHYGYKPCLSWAVCVSLSLYLAYYVTVTCCDCVFIT